MAADNIFDPWARFPNVDAPPREGEGKPANIFDQFDADRPHVRPGQLPYMPPLRGDPIEELPAPHPNVPWGTPDVEAAAYAQRGPGVFGKALGTLGLDASGRRAATTWPEAVENTTKGMSLLNFAHDVYQAAKRLKEHGGLPPEGDPYRGQAPIDALAVAGTAGVGSLAGERPPGAFGTFVGRQWAEGRAANGGKMTGKQVLDMADTFEQNGLPDDFIRRTGREMIARGDDPALGDFHKGADGFWKLEVSDKRVSDKGFRYEPAGPAESTVGQEITHPDLFEGLPELQRTTLRRIPGTDAQSGFRPGHPELGVPIPNKIDVAQSNQGRATDALHELQHDVSFKEGFARGGDEELFKDGGELAHLRKPGEKPRDAYLRMVGELDAIVTEARSKMSTAERIGTPVELTLRQLQRWKLIPEGEPIVAFYNRNNMPSVERSPRNPNEPSAFEQAQEEHWGEAGQRGAAIEQAVERQNSPQAGPASPRVIEKLGREDQLGRAADTLASNVSALETSMRMRGAKPDEIAKAIETNFGDQVGKVDPQDIANRTAWWHVATDSPANQASGVGGKRIPWSQEEREILARGLKSGASYTEIAKQIADVSGRSLNPNSVNSARINFGLPGNRRNLDLNALWPREANVMLFHLYEQGMPISRMAGELGKAFGQEYSAKAVGDQIERMRIRPRGPQGGDTGGQGNWQPDALALLKDEMAAGTSSAAQIADLIQKETGQVVSRPAVLGKMTRVREEQMRASLVEDLAKLGKSLPDRGKRGTVLRSSSLPISISDDQDDRVRTWGGY
jgi:hypothetical protein